MTEHPLAYATLHIMGDSVRPEFWTRYFGVRPDTAIEKGKPFVTPSGRESRSPGRVGLWGVQSRGTVESNELEPHLRYLIKRLNLTRGDLRATLDRESVQIRFYCYWRNESGDRVPHVPDDIRAMMEAIGGTVEIDEYR
ncbi:DUF4279 domain-containing protein [Caballeronia sp. J97]|uniref:DUF4279 domain-containing protein n=1 Tax=Caballeronia sp. J97 TaxID=2805429 RepID=UPI002AB0C699|nr:DUF4279 domain-containing protein [Caballeronia sp. J97]